MSVPSYRAATKEEITDFIKKCADRGNRSDVPNSNNIEDFFNNPGLEAQTIQIYAKRILSFLGSKEAVNPIFLAMYDDPEAAKELRDRLSQAVTQRMHPESEKDATLADRDVPSTLDEKHDEKHAEGMYFSGGTPPAYVPTVPKGAFDAFDTEDLGDTKPPSYDETVRIHMPDDGIPIARPPAPESKSDAAAPTGAVPQATDAADTTPTPAGPTKAQTAADKEAARAARRGKRR